MFCFLGLHQLKPKAQIPGTATLKTNRGVEFEEPGHILLEECSKCKGRVAYFKNAANHKTQISVEYATDMIRLSGKGALLE